MTKSPSKVMVFSSFKEFKDWLARNWFPSNPNAVQLDGAQEKSAETTNPATWIKFKLKEIPNIEGTVSLHGDTSRRALELFRDSDISDFIIVPPGKKNASNWRFHHKSIHGYENTTSSKGMYSYLKCA